MRKLILTIVSFIFVFMLVVGSVSAAEQPFQYVCDGPAGGSTVCQEKNKTNNPLFGETGILTRAIGVLALITGIASVIMVIVGGFKYVTSTGDPAKVNSAKDTILYAIIGAVVALLSQAIVSFVLTKT